MNRTPDTWNEGAATFDRRQFLKLAGSSAALAGLSTAAPLRAFGQDSAPARLPYDGPNVIIIRFGGGVRRRESIEADHTYSPFLCHELLQRGTLFPQMELADKPEVETSHGQGTLHILTGQYERYKDFEGKVFGDRFETQSPTVFEYLRKRYDVPEYQTLLVNGEDRIGEEFFTFSNHHLYGESYRSNVLSLFRFKIHLLRRQLQRDDLTEKERVEKAKELEKMVSLDYRVTQDSSQSPEMERFWEGWRQYYGETGLVNPRGDRVLTALTVRAMRELQPKLLMVNYQDCDYVHWGNATHYTRGIQIMDEGLQRIVNAVEAEEAYRDNTIIAVVPDCGRDTNRAIAVPFQHHFNTRSSHEIFAFFMGPGVAKNEVIGRTVDQTMVAGTIGRLMGFPTPMAESSILEEALV